MHSPATRAHDNGIVIAAEEEERVTLYSPVVKAPNFCLHVAEHGSEARLG